MAPVRQLDMDITETADARPVVMRHYPVAPQRMPELERQIKARLDAGIICESVSLYPSPVLFVPKKMANCACVSTIIILTDRHLGIATPRQSHLILLRELEGHACFQN